MLHHFLLAAMCWFGIKDCGDRPQHGVTVVSVQNINEYLLQNSDAELLQPMEAIDELRDDFHLRYKFGERVAGDRLVYESYANGSYPLDAELTITLDYPKKDLKEGAIVSYIECSVQQSSKMGKMYITKGGIGQRQITVVINSKRTSYFIIDAKFYGTW